MLPRVEVVASEHKTVLQRHLCHSLQLASPALKGSFKCSIGVPVRVRKGSCIGAWGWLVGFTCARDEYLDGKMDR